MCGRLVFISNMRQNSKMRPKFMGLLHVQLMMLWSWRTVYIYTLWHLTTRTHFVCRWQKKRYSLTKPYCDQPIQDLCNKGFNIVFLSFPLLFTESLNWFMETMQKLTMTFEWQESRHFTEYIKTYRLTSSYKSCTW